jgi:hypothetical protein
VTSKLRRAIARRISLSLRKKFEKIVATPFLFSQRDGGKKKLACELFLFSGSAGFFLKGFGVVLQKFWSFFYPPLIADQSPTKRKKL